jgi:type II restriction enzyme
MTQSEGLRNRLNGNVKNIESQKQDSEIKVVVKNVLSKLKEKYPTVQFGIDQKMMVRDIEKMVNSTNFTTSKETYIKPDGGFMWMKLNGKKYYILISEQKRQGTNDVRLIEGKAPQGNGNAAERLGKNVIGIEMMFQEEDIFPFIVFLQGCDFYDEESTIGDRIRRGGSYFMRGHSMTEKPGTSNWTNEEMYNNMFTIATTAIDYYLKKYGK